MEITEIPWEGETGEVAIYDIESSGRKSNIKLAINAEHLYAGDKLDNLILFDVILVQVGPAERLEKEDYGLNGEWCVPPLGLGLISPSGESKSVGRFRAGRRKLDPDLGSDSNHEIAKGWLQKCCSQHENCPQELLANLPTRVIDVGCTNGSESLRLFVSQGIEAPYVTLSHCWGGAISPVLTTENLQAFQKLITFSDLPANFRDAITITRRLGLRYLWIDSLCIIQDSKSDWEIESKKMGGIYRDSVVTISASVAASSTVGILRAGEPLNGNASVKIRLDENPDDTLDVALKYHAEESLRDLSSSSLNLRGWTLQESILSPRILHYGNQQTHWQCHNGFESADGMPHGNRMPQERFEAISSLLSSKSLLLPTVWSTLDKNAIRNEYYTLVEEYAVRNLSFDSDKFPAFSGLAELIHEIMGGEYLAGLWSTDMPKGLLWYSSHVFTTHVSLYRAPSWSWAVTNGHINFSDIEQKPEPGIFDAQILGWNVACGVNPYGQVSSGYITVSGFSKVLKRSNQIIEPQLPRNEVATVQYDEPEQPGGLHSVRASVFHVNDGKDDYLLSVINGDDYENLEWDFEIKQECWSKREYLVIIVEAHERLGPDYNMVGGALVLGRLEESTWDDEKWERVGVVFLGVRTRDSFTEWTAGWERKVVTIL